MVDRNLEALQNIYPKMLTKGYCGYVAIEDGETMTVYFTKEQGNFEALSEIALNDTCKVYTIVGGVVSSVTDTYVETLVSDNIFASNANGKNNLILNDVMTDFNMKWCVCFLLCVMILTTAFYKIFHK